MLVVDVLTLLAAATVFVVCCGGVLYFIKLRRTLHGTGSFMCSYRPNATTKWRQGWAVYRRDTLDWYPMFSLAQKPRWSWRRREIEIESPVHYRTKDGQDYIRVDLTTPHATCQMSMEAADHSGLVSWIEAAPPVPISWE
ncbi:MAG: DUF2550 family protein [Actinomycetaceae bacterium]|nr:DUF2550 family protein [Actinomycetaceae bacterium]